jgi:hypothetical protein
MSALGKDPLIRITSVETGHEVRQLRGQAIFDVVAFSPDGRTLIGGSQHRKEVYLWEVATGQLRKKFSGHQGHVMSLAFSPDGRTFASGNSDASVLIWEAAGQRRRLLPPPALTEAEIDRLWTDLAVNDAVVAYNAIVTLRAAPRQATALISKHLKPVPRADAKRLAEAVRKLDSDSFAVRQQATRELEKLGESAEPALRQALARAPAEEVRRRIEQLLNRLGGPQLLRRGRALEVLENIADPDSRQLLTALAGGASDASLTIEAQAAFADWHLN